MALEGTVKVPGIGPVKKQQALYGGLGAVVLVLGIWWFRQRKAARAAASAGQAASGAGGMMTDPAGNTCSAVNPATGYCPGTAEDQQALAGATAGAGPYDTSQLGGGGLSGYYYGSGGATQAGPPGPGNFADNAEWAQYVESYMIQTLNADPATVGNAIGKYLTGQPLTPDQQNIVQEAIAYGGQPPQGGASGNPPGINTSPGTSVNPGGTVTGTGGGTPGPGRLAIPSGVHLTIAGKTGVRLQWSAVSGAAGYVCQLKQGGPNGTDLSQFTVSGPVCNFGSLQPGTRYTALIWPTDAADPGGPASNQPHAEFSFTTHT